MTLPLQPLGDRVLIRADVEDRAPTQTDAGVVLAASLAAAVEGNDEQESWFVGTVVAVGPRVGLFNVRPFVLRRLQTLVDAGHPIATAELRTLRREVERLPTEQPDSIHVGDRVTFSWASGQQVTIDGERYLTMKASEILAVLEPDTELCDGELESFEAVTE